MARRHAHDIHADISFTPNGDWFVFSTNTGKTIRTGFRTKQLAVSWLHAPEGVRAVSGA